MSKKSMASLAAKNTPLELKPPLSQRFMHFCRILKNQWVLLVLCIPALMLLIQFKYRPMYGILIAFKKYKASRGIWGSDWLEPVFQNFERFFGDPNSTYLILNTLRVGIISLIFTYPAPLILAILINELRGKKFKRTVQTISYIPYFISVVVVVGMLSEFGSLNGLFNHISSVFGIAPANMNSGNPYFLPMYIGSAVWQGMGYGSIIYLSALSNVDTSLYDVANIDGANRWQKIRHIILPTILPTTTIILILNTGNILNQDFTKILLMQNDANRSQLDVISTFVYRVGIEQGQFSYATAVNLFVSVISFVLVFTTNMTVRKVSLDNSLW